MYRINADIQYEAQATDPRRRRPNDRLKEQLRQARREHRQTDKLLTLMSVITLILTAAYIYRCWEIGQLMMIV